MIAYAEFIALSQSTDSEERGRAAHIAAMAYVEDALPADEQAALYAVLVGVLDDPSVKVRAALAYGLLHSPHAPRSIMLALLRDSAIIARAVVQYSPVLIDADIVALLPGFDEAMLLAVGERVAISERLAGALIEHGTDATQQRLLRRPDVPFAAPLLSHLAEKKGDIPALRGALLARSDLPARARLLLVQRVTEALKDVRVVAGALAPARLDRLLRNSADLAMSVIGEREAGREATRYASELVVAQQLNTRVLLHAVVTGRAMFFADCIGALAQIASGKIYALLEHGSRSSLNALFRRSGLTEAVGSLLTGLVLHARAADLGDDLAARHYVVTALTEDLIAEYEGIIPRELEEVFAYLCEQNIALARYAARDIAATVSPPFPDQLSLAVEEIDRLLPAA